MVLWIIFQLIVTFLTSPFTGHIGQFVSDNYFVLFISPLISYLFVNVYPGSLVFFFFSTSSLFSFFTIPFLIFLLSFFVFCFVFFFEIYQSDSVLLSGPRRAHHLPQAILVCVRIPLGILLRVCISSEEEGEERANRMRREGRRC